MIKRAPKPANLTMPRMDLLRARSVDLFVARPLEPDNDPEMAFEVLTHERLLVACGADNPWARRRRVRLADLLGEPWVLSPQEVEAGSPFAKALRRAGLEMPGVRVISDSLIFRHSLLAAGRHLTLVPHTALLLAPRPPGSACCRSRSRPGPCRRSSPR